MNSSIIPIITLVVSIGFFAFLFIQIRKLQKRLDTLTAGVNNHNLEDVVKNFVEHLNECKNEQKNIQHEFERIRRESAMFFRKRGLVRFQAFSNTGGDQSFALALLDENNDGVIISSLYGRDLSKIYAKKIEDGKCPQYTLTEEEQQALNEAVKKS